MSAAALEADRGPGQPEPVALTGEQREAVRRRGEALALSAAAGSGKTSVLVERFVAAVLEDELSPARILAITFTDRAAGELRERVRARFLDLGRRAAARDTEAAFVATFHGFCARLLGAHPLAAGVAPGFGVLDEGIAASLRARAFAQGLAEFVRGERPDAVALAAAYGPERLKAMVLGVHARLRSQGQRRPRLPLPAPSPASEEAPPGEDARAACALIDELLVAFTHAYEQLKSERHALDFDDLELIAAELLERDPGVRAEWSRRFQLLMVDEFQDTNRRQLEILRALERENLFTVGDEFQAIYAFRHADVALFRARAQELAPAGASIALTRNFRSRPELVESVGALFEGRLEGFSRAQGARAAGARTQEPSVELLLAAKGGWQHDAALARDLAAGLPEAALWRLAEARLLARRVAELVAAGETRAGDVVVLLRALGDLAVYERALRGRGIATLAAAGAFWESREVEDLIAYLGALANPLDELALYSALASPLASVSRDGLAVLALAAGERQRGAFEVGLGEAAALGLEAPDERAMTSFCGRLQHERASAPMRSLAELLARALDPREPGGARFAAAHGTRGLGNARKLVRLARRFEAAEGRDLRAFLEYVATLKDERRAGEAEAPVLEGDADVVRLMSIHAAKGLEFPVVCVADLGRAPNLRAPDVLVDGPRVGLQLVRLDGAPAVPSLDYPELCEERRGEEAREEDRILYVAMTRARERLLLSGAIDLERSACEGPNGSAMSWLAPALAGGLGELQRAAQQSRGEPLVLASSAGAGEVRCVVATPASAAALLAPSPPRTPARAPCAPAGPAPAARTRAPAVHPGQLTLAAAAGAKAATALATGPAIETLSYSSLRELERCGYRHYLERVLRLPEEHPEGHTPWTGAGRQDRARRGGEADGPLQARARGTLVHRVLETFDFEVDRGGAAARLRESIETRAHELGVRLSAGEGRELAVMIEGAARAAPARRIAAARRLWREHPFAFAAGAGSPLVNGVIDLLAEEGDGAFLVVDYKSDPVTASEDLAAVVERDYALQRELYALAVLRAGAASVEVAHWFLRRPEEWVSARFDADRRAGLQHALEQRVARALRLGFSVSARPHRALCLTCPGRARLCSWQESETLREEPMAPVG